MVHTICYDSEKGFKKWHQIKLDGDKSIPG